MVWTIIMQYRRHI